MNIQFNNYIRFQEVKVGDAFQCKTGDYFLKISKKEDYNAVKLNSIDNEDELLYSIGKDTPCHLVEIKLTIF